MSTGISLTFTLGLLVTVTSCGLPFAVAWLGLTAASPGREPSEGTRALLERAGARGASAAVAFVAVFVAALLAEEAGAEISDLVPVVALVLATLVAVLGARMLVRRPEPAGGNGLRAALLFGAAYAIVSLPCALPLLQGLLEQAVRTRGIGAGGLGTVVLFGAGVVAALVVLALLAEGLAAAVRRLAWARAPAAMLAVAAGIFSAAYWVPAVGGVSDRGGEVAAVLTGASGAAAEFVATYDLAFALVLLATTLGALVASVRPAARY